MLLVDPLFQRILVKQCQSRKIPVIFDEVFTGFWRLGVEVFFYLFFLFFPIFCFLWWYSMCKNQSCAVWTLNSIYNRENVFPLLQSAAELLGCTPDIACYSKLLTGGVVPLAATLATDAVFSTFKADSKVMIHLYLIPFIWMLFNYHWLCALILSLNMSLWLFYMGIRTLVMQWDALLL